MRLNISTKQLSAISLLVAAGAVLRIGLGWVALVSPINIYGVLVKIGLTETLAFVCGFVFGPLQGFITGALIIVVSDLFMTPGPWTPFIAVIIGIIGVGAGVLRRFMGKPSIIALGISALILTLISEVLQDIWFAYFFGMPIAASFLMGIPALITAFINNTILFTTVGPRIIKLIQTMIMPESNQFRQNSNTATS
jgi:energy-coupling factor transport system substrate-specific component